MAITYFGSASTPSDNGSNTNSTVEVTPPASMAAGDLVLVTVQGRYTSGVSWTVPVTGGQSWFEIAHFGNTNNDAALIACRFNGTWDANPQFDSGIADCTTAKMDVFRRTGSTVQFDLDVMAVIGTFAAGTTPFTKTITGITTLTDGALVYAVWTSSDDNTWGSLTGGWTAPEAQIRNTGGSDLSVTTAYQVFASAGATGNVAKNQASLGGDAGGTCIVAFKEVDNTPFDSIPTVTQYIDFETSSDGTLITTAILGAATHPASPGGTFTDYNGVTNLYIETDAEKAMGNSVTCGGTTYADGSGTRGMRLDHNHGDDPGYFGLVLTTPVDDCSIGFFIKTSLPYGTYESCTFNGPSDAASGDYAFCNIGANNSEKHHLSLETPEGLALAGWILINTWYWITIKYSKTTKTASMAVYLPDSSWAQHGFTATQALAATPPQVGTIVVGQCGGGYAASNYSTWFDDYIIDTTGAFPLGPGAAGGGATVIMLMLGDKMDGNANTMTA